MIATTYKGRGLESVKRIRAEHWRTLKDSSVVAVRAWSSPKAIVHKDANGGSIIRAMATSDSVDLDCEVLMPGGADMTYINANRKVFVDHCYDTASCVGWVKKLERDPGSGGWILEARMLKDSPFPMVAAITGMAEQCGIGVSVGFEPTDYGPPTADESKKFPNAETIIRKYRLLEISFTCIPCNVSCQSIEVSADDSLVATAKKRLTVDKLRTLHLVPMLIVG